MMEQQQPTTAQAAPSLPSTTSEEENGGDQARPPRAQRQRPAARKAAKKRKALEFDDESGDEIEKERKTKVSSLILCARSRLLMRHIVYRELSATAPDSTPLSLNCLTHCGSILVLVISTPPSRYGLRVMYFVDCSLCQLLHVPVLNLDVFSSFLLSMS